MQFGVIGRAGHKGQEYCTKTERHKAQYKEADQHKEVLHRVEQGKVNRYCAKQGIEILCKAGQRNTAERKNA